MSCPNLPVGKVREIIDKTVETGNEHGFVRCADGSASKIVSGTGRKLRIDDAIRECDLDDGQIDIVHTHPNGVDKLSQDDRDVGASDDVDRVCVAVDGGDVYCERIDSSECEV